MNNFTGYYALIFEKILECDFVPGDEYSNYGFVLTGDNGTIFYSKEGNTWTQSSKITNYNLYSIGFN